LEPICIHGGVPLSGTLWIQGSKNAALPVMAACILVPGVTVLENCPRISDVECMCEILRSTGARVEQAGTRICIDASRISNYRLTEESVTRMRSSVILLGALLSRCQRASLYYPGGCVVGDRPIDLHLGALRKLGARIEEEPKRLLASADRLTATEIRLDFPSVGATENSILAAVLAEGTTVLRGCAKEPEIVTLCAFLNHAGARISGAGTDCITLEGVKSLKESCFEIPADRIVAGTYMLAAMAAGGRICLENVPVMQMGSFFKLAGKMGAQIWQKDSCVRITADEMLLSPGTVMTEVYPGFPTDLQSPLMAALCRVRGDTVLTEQIFNGRFGVAEELNRMGACIRIEGRQAKIAGNRMLQGCFVTARELRGGAALVLAGLCAQGVTCVCNRQFIDRGYEDIGRDLRKLGARIG